MKRFNFLMVLAVVLLLTNCKFSSNELSFDYIPAKEDSDGKWGMVDFEGNMLFSDEFENVPSLPIEGVFSVEEEDGFSVYLADKTPKLIDGLDNLKAVGNMTDGLMPIVRKDGRITYVNISGKDEFVLMPVDGKEIVAVAASFSCGRAAFKTEDGKWGYIDEKGKVVVKPIYDDIMPFVDDYAIVSIEQKNDSVQDTKRKSILIDVSGKEVLKIDDKYDFRLAEGFAAHKIIVRNGERWGFLDFEGKFTKSPKSVEGIIAFNDEGYVYENDEKYGFMSFENTPIIKAKYESFQIMEDGRFFVKNGDKYLIINQNGDKLLEIEDYDYISVFYDNLLLAYTNNEYEFLNFEGKPISANTFTDLSFVEHGYVYSDYFDANALADKVAELYSKNSFCNYVLGAEMKTAVDSNNAEEYSYESSITISEEKLPQGYGCQIAGLVGSTSYIAVSDWDYYNYSWNYTYNPDAKIDFLLALITTDKNSYDALFKALVIKFNNKGFKTETKDEAFAKLSLGDNVILISPDETDGKHQCLIAFVRKSITGYDEYENSLKENAKKYLDGKNSSGSED